MTQKAFWCCFREFHKVRYTFYWPGVVLGPFCFVATEIKTYKPLCVSVYKWQLRVLANTVNCSVNTYKSVSSKIAELFCEHTSYLCVFAVCPAICLFRACQPVSVIYRPVRGQKYSNLNFQSSLSKSNTLSPLIRGSGQTHRHLMTGRSIVLKEEKNYRNIWTGRQK